MKRAALLFLCGLIATVAMAQDAPERSLRPQLRAGSGTDSAAEAAASAAAAARAASTVPLTSTGSAASATPSGAASASAASASAIGRSLRPAARPARATAASATTAAAAATTTAAAAAATAPKPKTKTKPKSRSDETKTGGLFAKRKLRKTSVCGDIAIQGERVGKVPGKRSGCGVPDAVKVRSVSGVKLSTPSVMNCETAQALNTWVANGVIPAFKRRGKVVELKVAAHYICRTRNNKAGAKISEHGKGRAIDISGFVMKDGKVYTVQESWWRGRGKKPIQQSYAAACGPFGTTLGPTADRYHQDHFHLDTARYRSGPYCK